MQVSYHATALARQCPMKYRFYYINRLEPIRKPLTLRLGSVIHDAFYKFYNNTSHKECLEFISDSYKDMISQAGGEDQEDLIVDRYKALGMFKFYPSDLNLFEEITPEMEFKVPLSQTDNFMGRIDGLIRADDKYWIREIKTTGLSMRQFEGRAKLSYQTSGYMYGIQKLTGKEIQGVYYDIIRKARLRKRRTETAEMYGERFYDFYEDPKNWKFLYKRYYTYRTSDDLQRFEKDILLLTDQIKRWYKDRSWYRNTDSCWSYNTECQYKRICFTDKPDPLVLELYYQERKRR